MYNRLTLVNKLIHKDAITKIYNDHRQLAGFTTRNIRRYLPSDNPAVPRRVRTPRPKNSYAQTSEEAKLSTTQHEQSQSSWTNYGGPTSAINIHQLHEKSTKVDINQITESESDDKSMKHYV
jgi:hypothetical protein